MKNGNTYLSAIKKLEEHEGRKVYNELLRVLEREKIFKAALEVYAKAGILGSVANEALAKAKEFE